MAMKESHTVLISVSVFITVGLLVVELFEKQHQDSWTAAPISAVPHSKPHNVKLTEEGRSRGPNAVSSQLGDCNCCSSKCRHPSRCSWFEGADLLLAGSKVLWVLNSSLLSPGSQTGLWVSRSWWLALNRKFCKWFLARVLITFLLRFISTAEFSFAFFSLRCN